MNTSQYRFTLDLQSTQSQVCIPVTRGDTARTWLISFRDGSKTYTLTDGCLAKLEILRPTGTHIEEFCAIEKNATVRYSFSQNKNTAAVEGFHECAVVLYDEEGHIIGSPRFSMIVSGRVINRDNINLSDEDKLIVESMITAEVSRKNAESERVLAESSRERSFQLLQQEMNDIADGMVSPSVTVTPVEGGQKITIKDAHGEKEFYLMDGKQGVQGSQGIQGLQGIPGKNGENGKSAYAYALDGGYTGTEADFIKKLAKELPTKLSDFTNDSNFITASGAPVQSVNGKTGAVTLSASDVGARPSSWTPSYSDVGAEKSGTADTKISAHNTNTSAHNDIRLLIEGLTSRLNALANSDDTTLDQMKEVVDYIKANKSLIDGITTSKINVSDIVNNLDSPFPTRPLSAEQGLRLKEMIGKIAIPTKVSQLQNDSGYVQNTQHVTMTAVDQDGVSHFYRIFGTEVDENEPA